MAWSVRSAPWGALAAASSNRVARRSWMCATAASTRLSRVGKWYSIAPRVSPAAAANNRFVLAA